MAVTLQQVRQVLTADEPNYAAAARMGVGALPHLRTLVSGPDRLLAAKAAHLATLIDDDKALIVLDAAAASPHPTVRSAVAGGIRNVKRPAASGIISKLLNDPDAGVRKMAVKSAANRSNSVLAAQVARMSTNDTAEHVRSAAQKAAGKMIGELGG